MTPAGRGPTTSAAGARHAAAFRRQGTDEGGVLQVTTVSPSDLLGDLDGRGVRLYVADGQLRALAPKNVLTEELRQQIKHSREELIALLVRRANERDPGSAPPIRPAGRD